MQKKENSQTDRPLTILLHGLHQTHLIMLPLANRLKQAGFIVHRYHYHSVRNPLSRHSHALHNWLCQHHNPTQPINLVGHSLGGLVIRDFIHRFDKWQIHRCVTLCTPHDGSVTASYVKKYAPFLLGNAYQNGLDGLVAQIPKDVELGVIVGNRPSGLGKIFLNHHAQKHHWHGQKCEHDGTVYAWEAQPADCDDVLILPVSHTGVLFDRQAAHQVAHFLQHGQFNHHD